MPRPADQRLGHGDIQKGSSLELREMDGVGLLPAHTKLTRPRVKTSRAQRSEGSPQASPTTSPASSSATPRSARPAYSTRTNSAPLVPSSRTQATPDIDDEPNLYSHRESFASVQDDPFFENYRSPRSVSLAKELRSAAYSRRLMEEDDPPPRSSKRPSVDNSVTLPVCRIPCS